MILYTEVSSGLVAAYPLSLMDTLFRSWRRLHVCLLTICSYEIGSDSINPQSDNCFGVERTSGAATRTRAFYTRRWRGIRRRMGILWPQRGAQPEERIMGAVVIRSRTKKRGRHSESRALIHGHASVSVDLTQYNGPLGNRFSGRRNILAVLAPVLAVRSSSERGLEGDVGWS